MSEIATISEVIQRDYAFPDEKYDALHTDEFPALSAYFETWAATPPRVDANYRDMVVEKFRQFHNLENPGIIDEEAARGAKEAHNMLTNYLFSDSILPSVTAIHIFGEKTGDEDASQASSAVLVLLNEALEVLDKYARGGRFGLESPFAQGENVNIPAAFQDLLAEGIDGNPAYASFTELMKLARIQARQCLWENAEKPIDKYVDKIGEKSFKENVEVAIREFLDAKHGLDVQGHIIKRLNEGNTKAFVLSLDYNSTFNKKESFASQEMMKKVVKHISTLDKLFIKMFPNVQLFVVINTGRPGQYGWGLMEGLEPILSFRQFGIVEAGGAVLQQGMTQGESVVAVDSPEQWQLELAQIGDMLQKNVRTQIPIEAKQSTLSLRVAPRESNGSDWTHTSNDGMPVSDEWIAQKIKQHLQQRNVFLEQEYIRLLNESATLPKVGGTILGILEKLGAAGLDRKVSTPDDIPDEIRAELETMLSEHSAEVARKLTEIQEAKKTIALMQQKLAVKFNPTAGFIDITHADLNKYSTLRSELEKRGVAWNEAIMIHVGDSGTDIMPPEADDLGAILPHNAGADSVLLVGVADSHPKLKKAIEERGIKGVLTARKSALGLIDTLNGIIRATIDASQVTKYGSSSTP